MTIPDPLALGLGPEATIAVAVPDGGLSLYRLVEGPQPRERDFEQRLTRAQARRDQVPDLFRFSASHWLSSQEAADHSLVRRPWVATLVLPAGGLIRLALTELLGPGHVDVWADPTDLLAAVADVARLRRRV